MIRELTPQEINAAPEWAVKYWVMDNHGGHRAGKICFVNKLNNITQWQGSEKCGIPSLGTLSFKQIPRPPFDISEYVFSDSTIIVDESRVNDCTLGLNTQSETFVDIRKQDAIALAKHFKLTASDLL